MASEVKALVGANRQGDRGDRGPGRRICSPPPRQSVAAIQEIGGTIAQISEISTAIAAAVEEQGAATQEIARNVQQAAQGATQVTGSIADVNRGAADTGSKAEQVHGRAVSLLAESNQLNSEVESFLRSIRAA